MSTGKTLEGVFRGVVKDNRDPLKQHRIQVELDHAPGQSTTWAWPMHPSGITTPPPSIGQGVWVKFEKADPEFPLWYGEFGKHQSKNKKVHIKPLENTVSLTGISSYLVLIKQADGTQEVDLIASLVAMANKIKDLDSQLTTLHTTLATRTSPSHTHGSNG